MILSSLPIDAFLPTITATLRAHGTLVLVAEPGAGKTTRVPPAILDAELLGGAHPQLVMLQPRRVAARASAARIAEERRVPLGGDDVGYHVRFDKKLNDRTRLRVLTEGILTRQLVNDPFLDRVGCVVLDEFHERSLDVDIAIALLREIRATVRPDLKIVVMSATLDAAAVAAFLGDAPIVQVPGRTFPVEVEYRQPSERRVWERIADEVGRAHGVDDVLVFLPGAHEIHRCEQSLAPLADRFDFDVRPLHGSLSFEDQQLALQRGRRRKVVLATNIAETSLTIDGVTLVIDSGLARVPRFDPRKGLDRLELTRISQASATQRAGRAGRTAPGRCVRLWTSREQAALEAFEVAEIRRVDLCPTVLALRAWGSVDPRTFGWFDPPDEATLAQAENLLAMLGAIQTTADGPRGPITALGTQLARLPVHPRIGRLLLAGVAWDVPELACAFAAILSEKDFVRDDDAWANRAPRTLAASDLAWRAQLLGGDGRDAFIDRNAFSAARRVREELLRVSKRIRLDRTLMPVLPAADRERVELLLPLLGFPDRVCKRRENDGTLGLMVGGGGVRLHPSSVCRAGAFFLALDARSDERARAREASARIASQVEAEWLERLFPQAVVRSSTLVYEESSGRVVSIRRTQFHDLTLRDIRDGNVDDFETGPTLSAALRGRIGELLEHDVAATRLLQRLRFVAGQVPGVAWPSVDDAGLAAILDVACAGKRSREQVRFVDGIRALLPYPLDRQLDQFAPETIEVPTGSNVALDYANANANTAPVLAVRLQELFGLATTPRIAGGKVAVRLHLLAPNYKPVQVTDDLASFWANTYAQVRKDLRARYPKHSWPDDPLEAEAIRGPRKRP